MLKLTKFEQRVVEDVAHFLKTGNVVSATQVASFFVRSATSDRTEDKRRAALRAAGVEVA